MHLVAFNTLCRDCDAIFIIHCTIVYIALIIVTAQLWCSPCVPDLTLLLSGPLHCLHFFEMFRHSFYKN